MNAPPKAIRQARRSIPVAVERLEPRCLLAGFATVTEQLVAGGADPVQVIPQGGDGDDATPAAGAPSSVAGQGARTDAYVLDAGGGEPEVRVELRWAGGLDVGDGSTLVVLDAAGATLYSFPLDGVASLRATLDVPAPPSGGLPLGVNLIIHRGVAGSGDPGSYQLALGWSPTATAPVVPWVPADQIPPANLLPAGATSPLATPALWAAKALPPVPIPILTSGAAGDQVPPPPGATAAGGGAKASPATPVAVPDPSSAAGGVATPTAPTGGATTGGRGATIPIASTPAAATPAPGGAERGAATFVGPLPLGPSVPDGGIFASSFNSGSPPAGAGAAHGGLAGEFHVPGLATGSAAVDLIAGVGRLVSFGPGRDFRVAPPVQQGLPARSGSGPAGGEAAREALVAGAAFLPALATRAAARPASPAAPPPRDRSRDARRGWINPVVAILAVLTTSAVLVLKLNAPPRRPDWRS